MKDDFLTAKKTDKMSPEDLELRAQPRPVTRLNRKLLIGMTGTGMVLIFAATFYALQPNSINSEKGKQLYNIQNKETPENLNSLPQDYQGYEPPKLGAPLPGELGGAVLDAEARAGLTPPPVLNNSMPFLADPLDDIKRAQRIRLAQRKQQGRESSIFFQITPQSKSADANPQPQNPLSVFNSDFAATANQVFGASLPSILGQGGDGQSNTDQNGQDGKSAFLNASPDNSIYNPFEMQTPISPYQVMAGTVIAASLITGLNSDLPGTVIAQVTTPVYDTVTGKHLLIPQGTRLLGKYDSKVSFGQSRALVVWQRIILPNGLSIVIDNLPATDQAGYAGLEDEVDFHTWNLILGISLSTLLSVGAELAFNGESDIDQAIQDGSEKNINRAGQKLVERQIDVQPTIKIRPGYPLRIIVHKDIILKPYK